MQQRTTADAAACSVLGRKISKIPRARARARVNGNEKQRQLCIHTSPCTHFACARVCARLVAHVCAEPGLARVPAWIDERERETGCRSIARRRFLSRTKVSNVPGVASSRFPAVTPCMLYHRAIVSSSPRAKKRGGEGGGYIEHIRVFNWTCAYRRNVWDRLNQRATSYAKYVDFNSSGFQLTARDVIGWNANQNLYYGTGKYSSLMADRRLRRDSYFLKGEWLRKLSRHTRNIHSRTCSKWYGVYLRNDTSSILGGRIFSVGIPRGFILRHVRRIIVRE